jgi:DNA primase
MTYTETAVQGVINEDFPTWCSESRNTALFKSACRLYGFVQAGTLDKSYADNTLHELANRVGLDPQSTRNTLRSAVQRAKPANIPSDDSSGKTQSIPPSIWYTPEPPDYPTDQWMTGAARIAERATTQLLSNQGMEIGCAYLYRRGLTDDTIHAAQLGYIPVLRKPVAGTVCGIDRTIYLPHGIGVPWHLDDKIVRYQIRRLKSRHGQKMSQIPLPDDAKPNPLYFPAATLIPGRPTVLVEGEIDALSIWQSAGDRVNVAATGSVAWARTMRNALTLAKSSIVLLAFDSDNAGDNAVAYWRDVLPKTKRIYVPFAKDANELLQVAGDSVVRKWVESEVCNG